MTTHPAPSVPPNPHGRLPFLDWVRVGAFGLLILYHVGMFYVTWDWHVKSDHVGRALEPLMLLSNPWRLSLLFLVSGVATRHMADRMTLPALARQRLHRLGWPLLFVMAVIVVPQPYYEVVEKIHYADGYWAFWTRYLSFDQGFCRGDDCLTLPTWNHMWFVAYLLVYSLILAGLLAVGGTRPLQRLGEGWWTQRVWSLVLLPILLLLALRVALVLSFPITHDLIHDWYNHAMSFGCFVTGFAIARNAALFERLSRIRWQMLGLGIAAWSFYAWYGWLYFVDNGPTPTDGVRFLSRVAFSVEQWCMILAVLGFARRYLNHSSPLLRYLSAGVFPFYIIHQTLIVVVGHNLKPLALPAAVEAGLIILATLAGCLMTYELGRRVRPLAPILGLK